MLLTYNNDATYNLHTISISNIIEINQPQLQPNLLNILALIQLQCTKFLLNYNNKLSFSYSNLRLPDTPIYLLNPTFTHITQIIHNLLFINNTLEFINAEILCQKNYLSSKISTISLHKGAVKLISLEVLG